MHRFLRAVGFSSCKTRKDVQQVIVSAVQSATKKAYTTIDNETLYAEYHADFGERIGICVRGEYDENNKFIYDYYFPYLDGKGVTTTEDVSVERQTEKLSFAGIVDDYKIGVSIIFYLQNIITYHKLYHTNRLPLRGTTLTLSALSDGGTILLPIRKDETEIRRVNKFHMRKSRMIAEAKKGNEDALENLTIQDMDTYSVIHKKIHEEDVYSLVDTYFMPYGVECDLYSILGEITSFELVTNKLSGEKVYIMTLNVNDLIFDVCINQEDLYGEPEVGRRFKGVIWLQGQINYPEIL